MTEIEIRKKYRYSNLSYVFDVYIECEFRANLTKNIYDGLQPGEFRFDYKSWENRLGYSHKQMVRAIKELTTENMVIIQIEKGKKGISSKYFLTRFQEQKKEQNEEQKQEQKESSNINALEHAKEQNKEQNEEQKRIHSSQHNNLNIISNIYNANDYEEIWGMYPNKKGKAIAIKKIPKLLQKYGKEQLERCIDRYSTEIQGRDKQYILNGSTFFNGRYIDYLDSNYEREGTNSHSPVINQEDFIQA